MALGIYFPVKQMSAKKYHDVHRRLDEIGQANPAGRSVHPRSQGRGTERHYKGSVR